MAPKRTPRFCGECGSSLTAASKFCSACGAVVVISSDSALSPSNAAPATDSHRTGLLIAGLGAAVVVVLLGAAALQSGGDSKSQRPVASAPPSVASDATDDMLESNPYVQDLEVAWPRFPYNQQVLWCGMYSQGETAFAAWLQGYGTGTSVTAADLDAIGTFLEQNCPS